MSRTGRAGDTLLQLNPLLAGGPPAPSWKMLKLYESEVHPQLPS